MHFGLEIVHVGSFCPRNRPFWSIGLEIIHFCSFWSRNRPFWLILASKSFILVHFALEIVQLGSFWPQKPSISTHVSLEIAHFSFCSTNPAPKSHLVRLLPAVDRLRIVPKWPPWTYPSSPCLSPHVDPQIALKSMPKWPFLAHPEIHHTVGKVHFFARNRRTPPS